MVPGASDRSDLIALIQCFTVLPKGKVLIKKKKKKKIAERTLWKEPLGKDLSENLFS